MNPEDYPTVFTAQEVAGLFRCSVRLVYKLHETGQLRGLKLGNALRIPRREVLRLLGDEEPAPAPVPPPDAQSEGREGAVPSPASSLVRHEPAGQHRRQRRLRSTS